MLGEFRYGIAEPRYRAAYEAWLASELAHFDVLTDERHVVRAPGMSRMHDGKRRGEEGETGYEPDAVGTHAKTPPSCRGCCLVDCVAQLER